MSERLYYTDSYTCSFQARVVERIQEKNRFAVILDRTYFYPASGGQPADKGTVQETAVFDVSIRVEDGAVLHWLEKPITDRDITAEIDWPRRFDHMQQHTGQHILSQAFIRLAETQTVGFHLSDNSLTIDLDTPHLSPLQLEQVEQLANQVVWQNRPIRVHTVSLAEAQNLPLRKLPPGEQGQIRLIDIDQFDLTACGGTHVAHTGEVGLIKIVKVDRRGEQTRVEFRCGGRAWLDYRQKSDLVASLTSLLTTGAAELPQTIGRLQEDNKQAQRLIKKQQTELLQITAENLLSHGTTIGQITLITHVLPEEETSHLRTLANLLIQQPGVVVLLGLAGAKSQLLFCRSADAPGEMNQLIKPALAQLGGGGGGNASMAQGGGKTADLATVQTVLAEAKKQFCASLPG